MSKKIELTQEEIEALLVSLEYIADTDDDDEFENDFGIKIEIIKNVGRKLYNNCEDTNGRWEW